MITENPVPVVFVGVDTHKDTHTAVTVDRNGRFLSSLLIDTTPDDYQNLVEWAEDQGPIGGFGVEGTGSYGANLAKHLTNINYSVYEINRVNRQHRRRYGKTDETDAFAAAKAVASGEQTNSYKQTSGRIETIRVLQNTRNSAVKARTQAINQIHSLLITAPQQIINSVEGLTNLKLAATASKWRTVNYLNDETATTRHAIKTLAKRWLILNDEIRQADKDLETVLNETAPELMNQMGVGTDAAAKLVTTAGQNPERFKTEASFAASCGVTPVDCSSGKQQRHRLNRGGNRQANNALYTIAKTRMQHDPETQRYVNKKTAEGKTRKEIIRQLKRYIARQIYKQLKQKLT